MKITSKAPVTRLDFTNAGGHELSPCGVHISFSESVTGVHHNVFLPLYEAVKLCLQLDRSTFLAYDAAGALDRKAVDGQILHEYSFDRLMQYKTKRFHEVLLAVNRGMKA
jgi:hypothetical protein